MSGTGKAAFVSYGGRGGTRAGVRLREVLGGCRMDLDVVLSFQTRSFT